MRHCYSAGANTYLRKPSQPDEFAKVVAAVKEYWFGRNVLLV